MAQDHYKTLGVSRNASASEIKSAYRKIVLLHHPDKSPTKESAEIFLKAAEAYEILGDIDKRKHHDVMLEMDRKRSTTQSRPAQSSPPRTQPKPQPQPQPKVQAPKVSTVAADVTKLTLIFTRGQYAESEKLAREILAKDGRQPIPYAVLGDLARGKGNLDEAAKMYAFAAQMDPRNPVYQQRHEELIRSNRTGIAGKSGATSGPMMTVVVGLLLLMSAALYVVLAKEPSIAPSLSLINTWTLGLFVMLFLSGVSVGAVLCSGNFLDRFSVSTTNSLGKVSSPIIALTSIAVVNFWAAAVFFGFMCIFQRGLNLNHLRFIGGIALSTLLLTAASAISQNTFDPSQVFLWGGNLAYIGGICGWMVADSFKRM
jgi:hypothetical protein